MEKTTYKIMKVYLFDFFFWALVWLFFFSFFSVGSQNKEFIFWFSLILSSITIVAAYYFTHQLIPKFLIQKRVASYLPASRAPERDRFARLTVKSNDRSSKLLRLSLDEK